VPVSSKQWGAIASVAALGAVVWGVGAVAPAQADALSAAVVMAPGGVASENMEYVATIPIDSPGVSHAVREVGDQRLLFVNGSKGLTIYDIEDPALPIPMGTLVLPHSQNEDVQVSEDGTRAIIAADGGLPAPNPATEGLHIVDTSDPANPVVVAWLDSAGGGSNHTATCADAACEWIYASGGSIYHVPADADEDADIQTIGSWFDADPQGRVTSSHALNRSVHPDPDGEGERVIMISDSEPRLIMDATDPATPVLLATSDAADHEGDGYLQHNNARPNADEWRPRSQVVEEEPARRGPAALPAQAAQRAREATGLAGTGTTAGNGGRDVFGGQLNPGELVIGNSESNIVPRCTEESGGLTTWSIADFDQGQTMTKLSTFRPVNGTYADGNPAVNGLGCSGHWFDIQDDDTLIAASWYEHGVKVIEVQPDYSMVEIGFFQPVATAAGAASWVVADDGTEYIYSTDYARGLDIIRFHRDAPRPSEGEVRAAALRVTAAQPLAAAERLYCRLGGQAA